MLTYKGYTAKVEIDTEAGLLHGRVVDINDTITFEGKTVDDIRQEFHTSVDRYLEFCNELGQQPDKPFSGKLPFRTTPDVHRAIYLAAMQMDKSINAWMEEVLAEAARSTLMLNRNQESRSTPLEEYEYEQYLIQMEDKLNQLRETVKPYLKESDPSTIDQLLMLVVGSLQDEELKQFIVDAMQDEEDMSALMAIKPTGSKLKHSSSTAVGSKRKRYRHG